MNFLAMVTEVIQGCRVEGLGVRICGPAGRISTIWYDDGCIYLSSYAINVPPKPGAVLVSPLPDDAGLRMRLGK